MYPSPRPCEGGWDPRPCAGYNSACSHFWISEPTHRHERTDWRLGMEDWHEKAWTANQHQRDRLPRKDGAGASDCGRSAVHPPSTPPQTVSDIFHTLAFDRLSLLLRRRCQAARPPRTYSTGQLEACYLQIGEGYTRSFKWRVDPKVEEVPLILFFCLIDKHSGNFLTLKFFQKTMGNFLENFIQNFPPKNHQEIFDEFFYLYF